MPRRILAALAIVLIAIALLTLGWPQLLGLQRQIVFAQFVAFRTAAGVAALVIALLLAVVAAANRRARRALATAAVLFLVFAIGTAAVQISRGWNESLPATTATSIRVMDWNTKGDAPGPAEIAKVALAADADIVSLPETSFQTADAVASLMTQAGHPMVSHNYHYDQYAKARTTSLLISTRLGAYRLDTSQGGTPVLPSGLYLPVDGTGPTIIAAHPGSPSPGDMGPWRRGLAWLAGRCTASNVIMAGDFNSTLDHWAGLGTPGVANSAQAAIGGCHDAAAQVGAAAVGSWPTNLPAVLGTQIDHVVMSANWTATGFEVIQTEDGAGSDHRPVIAQLHPTG